MSKWVKRISVAVGIVVATICALSLVGYIVEKLNPDSEFDESFDDDDFDGYYDFDNI